MKFSEAPMMQTLLCKHTGVTWSDVFEAKKLWLSDNAKAVYLLVTIRTAGQGPVSQEYWRDVAELDEKWMVFDTVGVPYGTKEATNG